jgi:replicative DNA helicase
MTEPTRNEDWLRNLARLGRINKETAGALADGSMSMAEYEASIIQTEATLLHHIISSPACRIEVFRQVRTTDFSDKFTQQAWERMDDAWHRDIELSSPPMRKMWLTEYRHLAGAADRTRSWHEVLHSTVDYAHRRRIGDAIDRASLALAKPEASIPEIREDLEQVVLAAIDDRMIESPPTIREALRMYVNRAEALRTGKLKSIPLGFSQIDALLSIFPGDLVIIGARPRVGKTAFTLSAIRNMCLLGIPVGLFCIEMSTEDIIMRLISMESGVTAHYLRRGELSAGEQYKEAQAIKAIDKWPLHLMCGRQLASGDIHRIAETWVREHSVKAVFVDYLTLIKTPRASNQQKRYEVVGEICTSMKRMAGELGVPNIVLAQIGRSGANAVPRLEHLRETGSIEQDADVIVLLDRPDVDEPVPQSRPYTKMVDDGRDDGGSAVPADMKNKAAVLVAKQRNGDTGYRLVDFDGPTMRFYDDEPRS